MNIKNSSPKISVIVPVYNAEKYINQCVDSILNQGFTDFELLLINDGSKDKSGEICDDYAKCDQRVNVFHKENGGVSSARNVGIDHALGEYIVFIDSDDYVDKDYLSILMGGNDADLVVTGYTSFGDKVDSWSYSNTTYCDGQISVCLSRYLNEAPFRAPWDKRYKRSIIIENNIKFNPNLRSNEDGVFVHTYLLKVHNIELKAGVPYHYKTGGNDAIFKYTLSSEECLYTLHNVVQAYEKLSIKYNFICNPYYIQVNKEMALLYFRYVSKKRFTFCGYRNFKKTMKQIYPKIPFKDKLYLVSQKLVQSNMYFLSFFVLRFVYPLKLWIKGQSL